MNVADYGGTFGYLKNLIQAGGAGLSMENAIRNVGSLLDSTAVDTKAPPRNDLLQKTQNMYNAFLHVLL